MKFIKAICIFGCTIFTILIGGGGFENSVEGAGLLTGLYLIFAPDKSSPSYENEYLGTRNIVHVPQLYYSKGEVYSSPEEERSRKKKKGNRTRQPRSSWDDFYQRRPQSFQDLRSGEYLKRREERE